ncbi:hypothetical protein H4R33_001313 [Dimargaris cristalligena]|nr:hypothetical protein H4R33_001313 [Dimargaris cristalligena]
MPPQKGRLTKLRRQAMLQDARLIIPSKNARLPKAPPTTTTQKAAVESTPTRRPTDTSSKPSTLVSPSASSVSSGRSSSASRDPPPPTVSLTTDRQFLSEIVITLDETLSIPTTTTQTSSGPSDPAPAKGKKNRKRAAGPPPSSESSSSSNATRKAKRPDLSSPLIRPVAATTPLLDLSPPPKCISPTLPPILSMIQNAATGHPMAYASDSTLSPSLSATRSPSPPVAPIRTKSRQPLLPSPPADITARPKNGILEGTDSESEPALPRLPVRRRLVSSKAQRAVEDVHTTLRRLMDESESVTSPYDSEVSNDSFIVYDDGSHRGSSRRTGLRPTVSPPPTSSPGPSHPESNTLEEPPNGSISKSKFQPAAAPPKRKTKLSSLARVPKQSPIVTNTTTPIAQNAHRLVDAETLSPSFDYAALMESMLGNVQLVGSRDPSGLHGFTSEGYQKFSVYRPGMPEFSILKSPYHEAPFAQPSPITLMNQGSLFNKPVPFDSIEFHDSYITSARNERPPLSPAGVIPGSASVWGGREQPIQSRYDPTPFTRPFLQPVSSLTQDDHPTFYKLQALSRSSSYQLSPEEDRRFKDLCKRIQKERLFYHTFLQNLTLPRIEYIPQAVETMLDAHLRAQLEKTRREYPAGYYDYRKVPIPVTQTDRAGTNLPVLTYRDTVLWRGRRCKVRFPFPTRSPDAHLLSHYPWLDTKRPAQSTQVTPPTPTAPGNSLDDTTPAMRETSEPPSAESTNGDGIFWLGAPSGTPTVPSSSSSPASPTVPILGSNRPSDGPPLAPTPVVSLPAVTQDPNIHEIVAQHAPHISIAAETMCQIAALKANMRRYLEVPITVVECPSLARAPRDSTDHRVIFVDEPWVPPGLTARERSKMFYEAAVRSRLMLPHDAVHLNKSAAPETPAGERKENPADLIASLDSSWPADTSANPPTSQPTSSATAPPSPSRFIPTVYTPEDMAAVYQYTNVQYSLWQFGTLDLLVRNEFHGHIDRTDPSPNKLPTASVVNPNVPPKKEPAKPPGMQMVSIQTKVEYQSDLGSEINTPEERARWWLGNYLLGDAKLILARVDAGQSIIRTVERLAMTDIINNGHWPVPYCEFLHFVLQTIRSLPPGRYMMRHKPHAKGLDFLQMPTQQAELPPIFQNYQHNVAQRLATLPRYETATQHDYVEIVNQCPKNSINNTIPESGYTIQ